MPIDQILQFFSDEAFDFDPNELELDEDRVQDQDRTRAARESFERTTHIVESYKAAIHQGSQERGEKV